MTEAPLNLAELARVAGVSRGRVWEWLKTGCKVLGTSRRLRLPARRVGGRWKVTVADFEAWVRELAGKRAPVESPRARQYAADVAAYWEKWGS